MLGPATHNGDDEAVARITRIREASFDTYLDIPNHAQGAGAICGASGADKPAETFSWMVVEAGQNGDLQAHRC